MTRKISYLLVLCMILCMCAELVSCQSRENVPEHTGTAEDTALKASESSKSDDGNKKIMDIYIVAGQSNAAGYTNITNTDNEILNSFWSEYKTGVEGVLYIGRAESTVNGSTAVNEYRGWEPVKIGMGALANSDGYSHIGPELGMAAALSEYYRGAENGKTAGIIKYAHGGTSLLDNLSGENAASGNWVSPSYAESIGKSHSGLTGGLYRNLVNVVNRSYLALKDKGYDEINIKGIFWMQGESDRSNPTEYEKALKFFISDIRCDLGEKFGKDLSGLPFIIGEISQTSGSADSASVSVNNTFIAKQREIARETSYTYVVASGKYDVNKLVQGANVVVQDGWHWCTSDMLNIGKEVGKFIIDNILSKENF